MRPLALIGNVSRDVAGRSRPRVGGAVFYGARALRVLGSPARVIARCAAADRATLVPPLVALGIPVTWRPATETAAFAYSYDGEERRMRVDAIGDPWTPADVRGWAGVALARAVWVHVGALTRSDFPVETLAELARGRRLLLDGQGLVRPGATGPLELDADFDHDALRHVAVLKLAEDEATVLGLEPERSSLADLGVAEVVVTLGSRGAVVYAEGRCDHVAARAVRPRSDPTGAGDAFAAAYLAGRATGLAPPAAARRSIAVVGGLLSGRAQ